MDELTRIERLYGCVAEYERCIREKMEIDYEKSLQEMDEEEDELCQD